MDWKYKHFRQERTFPEQRPEVAEAARAFVTESLGWEITDAVDGFQARGYSFMHQATATFRIQSGAAGTRVAVELQVRRASSMGFMLFDVGGYYSYQINKWFEGIRWQLHQRLSSASGPQPDPSQSSVPRPPEVSLASRLFQKFIFLVVIEWLAVLLMMFFIFPLIGLFTGYLYLPGRGSGGLTIHGSWARVVSAMILMIGMYFLWKMRRKSSASI
jgi:hypothetical protein